MNQTRTLGLATLALAALSCGHAAPELSSDAGARARLSGEVVRPFNPHFEHVETAPDTRTPDEIAQAACTSALDTGWRCKKPGQPLAAAPWPKKKTLGAEALGASAGATSIIPASWTVPHWFVDTANSSAAASDFNSCTSAAAPCLTWQEIASHRLGCANTRGCVRLRQTTDVRFMSNQSGTTDPVYLVFALENSASFTAFANLPTATVSSHFTSVTQASGCNTPHFTDSASAGFGSPLQFVQDTTDGASAWCLDTSVGSNICQNTVAMTNATTPPSAFQTPGLWGSFSGAAGAITTTANYNAYANLVAVDVVENNPVIADYTGSTPTNGSFLYHVQVIDPAGVGVDPILWGQGAVAYESRVDRVINLVGNSTKDDGCVNCLANGGLTGGRLGTGHFWHMLGGQITANASIINVTGLGVALDGYVFLKTTATFAQGVSLGLFIAAVGGSYTMSGYSTSAAINPGYSGVSNGVQICAGTYNVNGGGSWRYDSSHGGLTGLIPTGSPTFELSGSTTAESHSGTGTVTVTNGITVNATNMDAAASATAFGGAAYWKGSFFGAL